MKYKHDKYKDANRLGLPICEKCNHAIHRMSKSKGYRHICNLTNVDVTQSIFGGNSPRICPQRPHPVDLI